MTEDNAAMLAELNALRAEKVAFTQKAADAERALADAQAKAKDEKAATIKAEIERRFESAIAAKRLLPASRERFFKWLYPRELERQVEFDLKEADAYIEENKVVMTQSNGSQTVVQREDEDGKTPDVVVMQRTKLHMSQTGTKDYKAAMVEVLRDDPELADKYRFMPGSR